jgi:hypothetical protein
MSVAVSTSLVGAVVVAEGETIAEEFGIAFTGGATAPGAGWASLVSAWLEDEFVSAAEAGAFVTGVEE